MLRWHLGENDFDAYHECAMVRHQRVSSKDWHMSYAARYPTLMFVRQSRPLDIERAVKCHPEYVREWFRLNVHGCALLHLQ